MHTSPLAPRQPFSRTAGISPTASFPQRVSAAWGSALTILSFLAIVFFTLFPFNFTVPHGMTLREAAAPFDWRPYDPSDPMDTVNNIILFLPFGFAIASFLRGRRLSRWWLIPFATGGSLLFSCLIEFLQQWLPTRDSSLADICSNTTGGLLGAAAFLLIGVPLLRWLTAALLQILSRATLAALAIAFAVLLACAVRNPLRMRHINRNLAAWDDTYLLSVGNDPRDDRAWQGSVSDIDIADVALNPSQVTAAYTGADLTYLVGDSVLASYRVGAGDRFADLTHHSPDLQWAGGNPVDDAGGPQISGQHWLQSAGPMESACKAIRDRSQFTVRCRFRSALQTQSPLLGRIFAISADSGHCNLILGQQQYDLVIRLRTPLTGSNGTNPAWKIGSFFVEPVAHDVILTYSDPALRVYVDGPEQVGEADVPADFGGVARYLARQMTLPFDSFLPEMYRAAFFLISFAALGFVVALAAASPRLNGLQRKFAVAVGLLAPTAAMQIVLVVICRRSFRSDNLIMGLAATAIVAIPAAHWLRRFIAAKPIG